MIDTENIKRSHLTTNPEDFVEYYPPDYNSMSNISVRECIYSKKSVLDNLFARGSPDYFKKDMTGNSAIYYAITAGNYQAIKYILTKLNAVNLKYSLQNQLNISKKSPISYSYEQLRSILRYTKLSTS
jgi:ankyrin repeat protein